MGIVRNLFIKIMKFSDFVIKKQCLSRVVETIACAHRGALFFTTKFLNRNLAENLAKITKSSFWTRISILEAGRKQITAITGNHSRMPEDCDL